MLIKITLCVLVCFSCLPNNTISGFIPDVNMTAPFTVIVLCNNSKYFCSGVVVDLLWVLTAAHCFHDLVGKLTENDSSVMVLPCYILSNFRVDLNQK